MVGLITLCITGAAYLSPARRITSTATSLVITSSSLAKIRSLQVKAETTIDLPDSPDIGLLPQPNDGYNGYCHDGDSGGLSTPVQTFCAASDLD